MNIKNEIKAFFGNFIGFDFCQDCGSHLKPAYRWFNRDGDESFCLKCKCGLIIHKWRHTGQ